MLQLPLCFDISVQVKFWEWGFHSCNWKAPGSCICAVLLITVVRTNGLQLYQKAYRRKSGVPLARDQHSTPRRQIFKSALVGRDAQGANAVAGNSLELVSQLSILAASLPLTTLWMLQLLTGLPALTSICYGFKKAECGSLQSSFLRTVVVSVALYAGDTGAMLN